MIAGTSLFRRTGPLIVRRSPLSPRTKDRGIGIEKGEKGCETGGKGGEMQIEGAAVVIFRSRRAEGMKKNRAGVQGRHFLRIKRTRKEGRKKRRGKGNEGISHALTRLIRKMSDRMVFRRY